MVFVKLPKLKLIIFVIKLTRVLTLNIFFYEPDIANNFRNSEWSIISGFSSAPTIFYQTYFINLAFLFPDTTWTWYPCSHPVNYGQLFSQREQAALVHVCKGMDCLRLYFDKGILGGKLAG